MQENKVEHFRVLAVDDEEFILALYREVLSKKTGSDLSEMSDLETQLFGKVKLRQSGYSFDLVTCHQGDEAVVVVKQAIEEDRPFALAFLDVRMPPGPDGVQTAEIIRSLDPMIEILLVTGFSDIEPLEIAQRITPAHKFLYMQKPFHPHEIYQFACTLCSKWKNESTIKNYNERLLSHIEKQTEELNKTNEGLREEIRIREESEKALRESERKFRDLFEKSSDHLYLHDLEGRLISSNLAFKSEYGYEEKDLYHANIRDLVPDRYREKFDDYIKRIIEKGQDQGIMKLKAGDGKEFVVEYSNSLIRDSNGRPVAVRGSGRDVTERLSIERQKQRLEMQIMRMQRMEAIGTLAGGIAHNFNNLLMGILGNASLASLEIGSNTRIQDNLENIKELVESGSRLTRQLLNYSRGGAYEIEPVELGLFLKKTSETFGSTRRDILVHHKHPDNLYSIDADRGQIEQVLVNLFVNAADAMPEGGEIFLETQNVSHLQILDKPFKLKPGDYVQVTVRDTGTGMDEGTIEHIFEPFFTTKGLARGTGLGLASVYGIIKAHGGYIGVDSKKGKGTAFIIYLPASKKNIIKEAPEVHEIIYGHETILLVDDEDMILEMSGQILSYLGYSVIKAKGGRQAIEIFSLKRDQIDLVILDLVMPEIGGGAVFDKLAEIKKDIKVVLSSGYSIDGQVEEILGRGCRGFIQKPFDIKELSVKLREVLK